jgi:hypothetical protein
MVKELNFPENPKHPPRQASVQAECGGREESGKGETERREEIGLKYRRYWEFKKTLLIIKR